VYNDDRTSIRHKKQVVNIIKQNCLLNSNMARKYQLKRRADRQEETRRRIVEATVALHESVGGAGATISAIAERAGVERLTVYRHFPDERALVTACTQYYWHQHSPPDLTAWKSITNIELRLRTALGEIYAYHRRTERMSLRAFQGMIDHPLLREVLAPQFAYWSEVRDVLSATWTAGGEPHPELRTAIGHAIGFMTWYSLVREQGLDDAQAIALMVGMLRSVECTVRAAS
jgi:AcrR family transcriptional regulator